MSGQVKVIPGKMDTDQKDSQVYNEQASIPDDFDPQSHSTGYSLQDTNQPPVSAFIKLRQEVSQLKKELQESRDREKDAQKQLIDRICTENDVENDLRSRIAKLEEIIKAYEKSNADKLLEAKKTESGDELKTKDQYLVNAAQGQILLEDTTSNKSQIKQIENEIRKLKTKLCDENKEVSNHTEVDNTYSTLRNLTLEAEENIEDIENNLILEEDVINTMSTDRVQKLVRDTKDHEKAKEKMLQMKVEIRNELGNAFKVYSKELRKNAERVIEILSQTKKRLDENQRMLESEANERRIRFSKMDTEMSKFYQIPTFTGEDETLNIYEFLEFFQNYLEVVPLDPDDYGAVMKCALKKSALNVANKAFPVNSRPSMDEVKALLIKHFGKMENIISNLQTKHEEIGKIPDPLAGDMDIVYKKSSDHACLIQKALMLENNGYQVILPVSYLDTLEKVLPPTYRDKYVSYEISHEYATPRQKLQKMKELVDEIEAKGLLKSTLESSSKKTSEILSIEDSNAQTHYQYSDWKCTEEYYEISEDDSDKEDDSDREDASDRDDDCDREDDSDQEDEEPDQEEEFDQDSPKLSYHYPTYSVYTGKPIIH